VAQQQYLPPMVPAVPFPGIDPRYPPVPQLAFPLLAPNSIVSRRNASRHPLEMASNGNPHTQNEAVREFLANDNTSSGLSKEEPSFERIGIAKPGFNVKHLITSAPSRKKVPVRNARDIAQERQDTPLQRTPTSASHMKRSRLPSNEAPRKAPLRATSSSSSDGEDGELTNSGQKRPKANQQRLSAKPTSLVKPKRARRPSNYHSKKVGEDEFEGEKDEQPRRSPELGLFSPPKVTTRPRPRHEYVVPEKLLGTAKALGEPTQHPFYIHHLTAPSGPDNWNDYIVLMERWQVDEISERFFRKFAMPLFQTFDQKTRQRLNDMILKDMIVPVLEQVKQAREAYRQKHGSETKDAEA
jgi:hypothetical protein